MTRHAGAKVAMDNKIGEKLDGWFKDVALALQKGIFAEGQARKNNLSLQDKLQELDFDFEAPEADLFNRCRLACGYADKTSGYVPIRYFAMMGNTEQKECRKDPNVDNRAVTYSEMCSNRADEGLSERHLRDIWKILPKDEGRWECGDEPNLALIGGQDAAGKSGSFFFLSKDQQLIAKSCTDEDWKTLLRILEDYTKYVEAAQARRRDGAATLQTDTHAVKSWQSRGGASGVKGFVETLLPRYLGLYSLRLPGEDKKVKPIKVLVMANVF